MPKKHFPKNHGTKIAYTQRLVEGLSATNRPRVEAFLRDKATHTGVSNAQALAVSLSKLDKWLNGGAIERAAPEQLRDYLLHLATRHSAATVNGDVSRLRHYLKWAWDVDLLPRAYQRALRCRPAELVRDVEPVSEDEFRKLLAAASCGQYAHKRIMWQALLWTLWDSGFRGEEALSLRASAVLFDDKSGGRLRLQSGDAGLKTGARTVYVIDCIAPLKAWLALHPDPTNPDAYLFPGAPTRPTEPMARHSVNSIVDRLARRAEVRHVWPHLFRHTRATRAARTGWNEAQMRAYFGWAPGSIMPAVYIHLAQRDMEERVRRDAGIDENGFRLQGAVTDDVLDSLLKKKLKKLLLED